MANSKSKTWDIFCRVIDNYGDIGVCWRLCKQLAERGETVRLIVDDARALAWMATPAELTNIEVVAWTNAEKIESPGDVVIESFGCELPEPYIAKIALQTKQDKASTSFILWINLEYFTAERYAEECHLLPSPIMHGAGKGFVKTFFYPGFTSQTGGLLRESDLFERQAQFDKAAWLQTQNINWTGERIVSLFCYEPAALTTLLTELKNSDEPTLLLVTAGRATKAVRAESVEARSRNLCIHYLPHLTQDDYDHLLWVSDFNFVRGEDSLVRAIWAGKPFVWQIYPQDDNAHHAKLEAFLDVYLANMDVNVASHIRAVHYFWNEISKNAPAIYMDTTSPKWQATALIQRDLQANQPDLVSNLIITL